MPRLAPDISLALKDADEPRVSALSAALLRAAMRALGEGEGRFAMRAGIGAVVVAAAVSGARPAWDLPYSEFAALAGAVAALWPCAVFETATACDLLLSCVLNGDQFMATDVLTEPRTRELARALLRLALANEPVAGIRGADRPLLPDRQLALLSERAAVLAACGSPDAWVGLEILAALADRFRIGRMAAGGTTWRLRSLVAMGHDAVRISRALDADPQLVRRLIRGDCQTVAVDLYLFASRLWDAWWDKTPPQRTGTERRAAARARHQAERHDWPAAAGLDEGLLDQPGYRPACGYRPAIGTGVAPDLDIAGIRHPKTRQIA